MQTISLRLGLQQVSFNNALVNLSSETKMEIIHGLKLGIIVPLLLCSTYVLMYFLFSQMNSGPAINSPYTMLVHVYFLMPTFVQAFFREGLSDSTAKLLRVCTIAGAIASGAFMYLAKF
jgi:hypothetical protein